MERKRIGFPVVLAVCGKGGVGKTCISALMVKALCSDQKIRVLAIDADPAVGLASALGVAASCTVDDIRNELIAKIRGQKLSDRAETVSMLEYELFSALAEHENLAFLAIGRPETDGCYCRVNRILKEIIGDLASGFDYVVIDGEAGIEQVNRRVMERVTHLLLVADPSARAVSVAVTIMDVARRVIEFRKAGIVLNRVRHGERTDLLEIPQDMEMIGTIPDDETIHRADLSGTPLLNAAHGSAYLAVAGRVLAWMNS